MKDGNIRFGKRLLCLVVILCGLPLPLCCAQTTVSQQAEAINLTEMKAYLAVLEGKQTYIGVPFVGEPLKASSMQECLFSPDHTSWDMEGYEGETTYERFCITDLDADGHPELILEIQDREGYPIAYDLFRYEAGQVYCFTFGIRSMSWITREGAVAWSNGAADNGWSKPQFAKDQVTWTDVCRYYAQDEVIYFTVDGERVTQPEYEAYVDTLLHQPQPVWMAFSLDAVQYVVKQFEE